MFFEIGFVFIVLIVYRVGVCFFFNEYIGVVFFEFMFFFGSLSNIVVFDMS